MTSKKSGGIFSRMFGGSGKDEPKTTGEAIQGLREMEDMLFKKQDFLEKKIESEVATARKQAKTNKRLALGALKRKKRYEGQLQQIDGTLTTLEQQREALESANTNTAVLTTMSEASKAMKRAHANMDVDQVHDMMDDIAEQHDVAKEISDAISSPVAFGQEFDDDELEAELKELEDENELQEQEDLDRELLRVGPSAGAELPEVPTAEPAVAAKPAAKAKQPVAAEDDDLAELAAWAS